MIKKTLLVLSAILVYINSSAGIDQELVNKFLDRFPYSEEITRDYVEDLLDQAEYRQDIIDKLNRPAEGLPWYKYRNIFLTEDRIIKGVEFWNANQEVLEQVSEQSGVPQEVIIGILGVETMFGERKGSYRVLDALYTIAFGYPKRATYFTKELENFILLANEENLDITGIKGSYAGAMGYCQFMPSSYRAYAKSYDDDGSRDLVNQVNDAMASIANYLEVHRWKPGQPITQEAVAAENAVTMDSQSLKPKKTVRYYNAMGYSATDKTDPLTPSTLIQLENEEGKEYWFGFENFYVITRYNHSPLYALAVYQLGKAIKSKR